jgi:hypothetical protein
MLDVAFDKLSRSRPQQVFARYGRLRGDQRHAVLQLVTKAISTACLIESRAGPDAAGQRLIQQPAVEHDIHCTVRGLYLDCAEDSTPVAADFRQRLVQICLAILCNECRRVPRIRGFAKKENDLDAGVRR